MAGVIIRTATRITRLLRRASSNEDGVAAVEFGLLALPFFAVLIAAFELGLIMLGQIVLDNATMDAARLIRTGQATGFKVESFKENVCDKIGIVIRCGDIKIDVRTFPNFNNAAKNLPPLIDADNNSLTSNQFQPGAASSVVVVRVYAELPSLTSSLGLGRGNLANGARLIASTAAFRNEPF